VKTKIGLSNRDQPSSLLDPTVHFESTADTTISHLDFSHCCQQGQIIVPQLDSPPPVLWHLLTDSTAGMNPRIILPVSYICKEAQDFRYHIRAYNNMFAFSSLGVKIDKSVWGPKGVHTFRIQGELCHLIGSLLPEPARKPAFQQIYIFDPDSEREIQARVDLMDYLTPNRDTIRALQNMLWDTHPYCKVLNMAKERLQTNRVVTLNLQSVRIPQRIQVIADSIIPIDTTRSVADCRGLANSLTTDLRLYNRPTASEIAVLIEDDNVFNNPQTLLSTETTGRRDIIIQERNDGKLHRISEMHSLYAPLRFPLIFPYGEHGWHPHLWRNECLSR
jgi:hypothetical protein